MAVANGNQPHVPAWKRLGLKLKYAKDTAEPPSNLQPPRSIASPLQQTRRPQLEASDQTHDARPTKRRRTSSTSTFAAHSDAESLATSTLAYRQSSDERSVPDTQETAVKASVETAFSAAQRSSTAAAEDPVASEKHTREARKRQKSVTFTGETKQGDGNSAKSFVDPTAPVDATATAVETAEPSSPEGTPTKKEKKAAKQSQEPGKAIPKSKKKAAKESRSNENREYVRYLEQFRQDRASWKFNKNHQTALLKNVFDTHAVEPSLTPALAEYIAGLQGAGPRERLIESATAILKKFAEKDGTLDEIETMNTESARREAYYKAMWREVKKWEDAGMPQSEYDDLQLEQMKDEAERGKRAEAVLRALPLSESSSQASPQSSQTANDTQAVPSASTKAAPTSSGQKRKKRVEVSSDSSSDSSDSDADSPAPAKGPLTVSAALRPSRTPQPKPAPSRTPAYQHDGLNTAYRPQNPSQLMGMAVKPTRKIFDDDLLDQACPKMGAKKNDDREGKAEKKKGKKKEKEKEGKKRKASGYAYTHGNTANESGSEED